MHRPMWRRQSHRVKGELQGQRWDLSPIPRLPAQQRPGKGRGACTSPYCVLKSLLCAGHDKDFTATLGMVIQPCV